VRENGGQSDQIEIVANSRLYVNPPSAWLVSLPCGVPDSFRHVAEDNIRFAWLPGATSEDSIRENRGDPFSLGSREFGSHPSEFTMFPRAYGT
jgi:hypothetical protein